MRFSRSFAILLALIAPAAPASAGPAVCLRELAVTETRLLKALVHLQAVAHVSEDNKCATYRTHADVLTQARAVFERCGTGRDREQDVDQMNGALDQINTAIASTCATQ
jgi:hypothetical protein